MTEPDPLAARFEGQRTRLRGVAYRMLGSLAEAEDVVQEAWLRLARTDAATIENLDAWLTTVVARLSLNVLRARAAHPTQPLDDGSRPLRLPDPLVGPADAVNPEHEVMLADSVGLALQVVLEEVGPDERLAFVLHDVLQLPFDEIGRLLDRSTAAARQLASRARRRVRAAAPSLDVGLPAQRWVVEAFFAAARRGDVAGLVAVLHPDAVLRLDIGPGRGGPPSVVVGAAEIAGRASYFAGLGTRTVRPVTVNAAAGVVVEDAGRVLSVMGFGVVAGRVASIDVLADPERLAGLGLAGQ